MEMEQAIQRHAAPPFRGWAPRRRGAILVCAIMAPLMLACWVLGGFRALGVGFALMKGETILVDSPTKSFGVVAPGDPIAVSYKLTNWGDQDVRIVGFRAKCKCMAPDILPFVLHPRESRDLSISIVNRQREGEVSSQTIDWIITIFTTNPAQVQIPLTVKGEIRAATNPSSSGS
jgi:hypothetical protein